MPVQIWCLTDDKPGHRSQLLGLAEALAERCDCDIRWLSLSDDWRGAAAAPGGSPQLLLCAGHATHWPAIRLRRRYGGLLVALLKPSLPRWLFDLCVVPEHDAPRPGRRIMVTCGTLNDIRPATNADPARGLILIGGPSRHHGWDDHAMLEQVAVLRSALPDVRWTLTTSRRTPDSFTTAACAAAADNLEVVPVAETDRGWLRRHYADCGVIWVSEDSASMVYEALTAGARVGVLPVPRMRHSRVSRGLEGLLEQALVTPLEALRETGRMRPARGGLNEAGRVADYLLYWLKRQDSDAKHESAAGVARAE